MYSKDSVRVYLETIGDFPLLTQEEEVKLGLQVAEAQKLKEELSDRIPTPAEKATLTKGIKAKDEMIQRNMRLVAAIAKEYQNRGLDYLDLMQEGMLGLIRAVEKFDATKGYRFSTYAYWWVRQALTRAIANNSRTIRLPIYITDSYNKVRKATKELYLELNRYPSKQEIARHLRWRPDKVDTLLQHIKTGNVGSLNYSSRLNTGDEKEVEEFVSNRNAIAQATFLSPEEYLQSVEKVEAIEAAIELLTPSEKTAIELRFKKDYSLASASRIMGVSRERVRQLQNIALSKLKKHLKPWS